jgi:heme exporter protein A
MRVASSMNGDFAGASCSLLFPHARAPVAGAMSHPSSPSTAGTGVDASPQEEGTPAVEVRGLSKTFGRRRAVGGVDFVIRSGECLALFGPNGAGKTTLLRVLAGLLKPSEGWARIAGSLLPGGAAARAGTGLLMHDTLLYGALSALENVEFTARLYGVRDPAAAAATALERMGIARRAGLPVRQLSRGMQQRVAIARATVHSPRVLLLDEPFTGLDDTGAVALTAMLNAVRAAGAALLLVTHNLAEGLALATHAAVMRRGVLVRHEARAHVDTARYAAEYRELLAHGS